MNTNEQPTTTHGAWGSGNPHLRIRHEEHRQEFRLVHDTVRIGSDPGSDLILPGADPLHATIVHEEHDEYVLTMHGPGEMNAVSFGPGERSEVLRTGSRFTIGDWEFVFGREEASDHGRPYGGRQGGEGARQPIQPPRPDYREDARRAAESGSSPEPPTILSD